MRKLHQQLIKIRMLRQQGSPLARAGFTIVELMLAMAFVSVLLVTIAYLTTNIISIYQKGLSLKAVNSTGREIIDDFSRVIAASTVSNASSLCNQRLTSAAAIDRCRRDHGYSFNYQERTATMALDGQTMSTPVPTSGIFCTGSYSYLWNTGYILNDDGTYRPAGAVGAPLADVRQQLSDMQLTLKYRLAGQDDTSELKGFRLVRVKDYNYSLCASHVESDYSISTSRTFDMSSTLLAEAPVELISASEDALALYDLRIFPPVQNTTTSHYFYSGTFILGTIRGGVNITADGNYCTEAADNLNTDFAYCAINKFNFATRATGETLDE